MHVVSRKRLKEFWQKHPDAKAPLEDWFHMASRATWRNLADVRQAYPHADPVGSCTVFNIAGNKYRLITWINYAGQKIFIRQVLTHAEYNKGAWKSDCGS